MNKVFYLLIGILVALGMLGISAIGNATIPNCQAGNAVVEFLDGPIGIGQVAFPIPFDNPPIVVVTPSQVMNRIDWQAVGYNDHVEFFGRTEDAGSARETVVLNWIACEATQVVAELPMTQSELIIALPLVTR